jgi:outer membrane protein assembly factor BamB
MSGVQSACSVASARRAVRFTPRRVLASALAAVAVCGALPWSPGARAEGEPDRNIVHLPESRFIEVELKKAEDLAGRGRWDAASRIWLDVLREQRRPRDGIQHVTPVETGRFVSYARVVRERLAELPNEGLKAFGEVCAGEARALFTEASEARDEARLDDVWRLYPVSGVADDALELLGDLALERGAGALAAERYRMALEVPGADVEPKRMARKRAGAGAAAVRALQAAAERRAREASEPWALLGRGDALPTPGGVAEMSSSHPVLPPGPAARAWARRAQMRGAYRPGRAPRLGRFADIVPTIADGRLVIATGRSIACYELATGRQLWRQSPWTGDDHNQALFYGATVAGGRVFAPFVKKVSRAEYYRGIPIKTEIPNRRLVAFDLRTGKRVWDHAESEDPFLKKASIALAPVESAGRLYAGAVLRQGQLKCYVVCVDAATGGLVWRRYLGAGQVEMTMFGEHAVEPLAMRPVLDAGRVYHATGTGLFACISALGGDVEWVARYEAIKIQSARSYYAIERDLVWANVPPVVVGEVAVVTPVDSRRCYAFGRVDGDVRWWIERDSRGRLVGVHDGRAVLLGEDGALLVEVATGKRVMARRDRARSW